MDATLNIPEPPKTVENSNLHAMIQKLHGDASLPPMISRRTYHHPAIMAALRMWRQTNPVAQRTAHHSAGAALRQAMDTFYLEEPCNAEDVDLAALEVKAIAVATAMKPCQSVHIFRYIGRINEMVAEYETRRR